MEYGLGCGGDFVQFGILQASNLKQHYVKFTEGAESFKINVFCVFNAM